MRLEDAPDIFQYLSRSLQLFASAEDVLVVGEHFILDDRQRCPQIHSTLGHGPQACLADRTAGIASALTRC
ncbi:hypothetical protein ASD32_14700 [Rhizobium sp. Root483D2]|nr:hypothetical protein ASD32_14700 [Rhizobium sp. Root483D2]